MICDLLTTGRDLPCKKGVGGVKAFYLFDGAGKNIVTIASAGNTVEDIQDEGGGTPVAATAYKWDIRSASNVIETETTSLENRTVVVDQIFTGILHGMDNATNNELLLFAYGSPFLVAHYYNGDAVLMGLEFGCNLDTAVKDTGTGLAEFNGYTLTVSAQEITYANYLIGATKADPFAGLTTPPTVFTPNTAPSDSPVA